MSLSLSERGLTGRELPFLIARSIGDGKVRDLMLLLIGITEETEIPRLAAAAENITNRDVSFVAGRCRLEDGRPHGSIIEFVSPRAVYEAGVKVGYAFEEDLREAVGREIKPVGVQVLRDYPWWAMVDLPMLRLGSKA